MITLKQIIVNSIKNNLVKEALVLHNKTLRYSDFWQIILKIISAIENIKLKLRKSSLKVAIYSYRNEFSYAAPIASILTNCCFVPLNKNFPKNRNINILNCTDVDIVILDADCANEFYDIYYEINYNPFIYIDEEIDLELSLLYENKIIIKSQDYNLNFSFDNSDHIAYILFTSGSTGVPKGVPINYSNLEHLILFVNQFYNFSNKDKFSQTFEQTFDLSIFDIFTCFSSGGCLVVPKMIDLINPFKFIEDNSLTVWFSVPSIVSLAPTNFKKTNTTLRTSLFCGEIMTKEVVDKWAKFTPNSIIYNLYGPTELTIACSHYRCSSNYNKDSVVPIGKLFPNNNFVIINQKNKKTKKGELCISGVQMFNGYLNKEYNFIEIKKIRYYKTGDLVYIDENQDLVCLGRLDNQVKIQGYRVELVEIESTLEKIDKIDKAIVICIGKIRKSLVAYIKTNQTITIEFIKNYLGENLPWYMVPKEFNFVSSFQVNSNGKIDRKILINE